MMLWFKTKPVLSAQGANNLNVRVLFGSMTNSNSTSFEYSNYHKFAIVAPILMIMNLLFGYVIMLLLFPHLPRNFIISDTISAIANNNDCWPTFITLNAMLSGWLLFIGMTRCMQIHHQLMHINPSLICMRRLNVFTLCIGGIAVISIMALSIIRIKIDFDLHILFAEICFWAVIFYQFFHIVLCWILAKHCQLSQSMRDTKQRKYFHVNVGSMSKLKLPSSSTLAVLTWFILCNIVTTGCLMAFTIEQSGFRYEESQFGRESNILEWIGIFTGFLYFIAYSSLFYSHPIRTTNRKGDQMPIVAMNDLII